MPHLISKSRPSLGQFRKAKELQVQASANLRNPKSAPNHQAV